MNKKKRKNIHPQSHSRGLEGGGGVGPVKKRKKKKIWRGWVAVGGIGERSVGGPILSLSLSLFSQRATTVHRPPEASIKSRENRTEKKEKKKPVTQNRIPPYNLPVREL